MDPAERNSLLERNSRIIAALLRKAEAVCPGAVDLVGVAGSFASGDIHSHSDLDLLIVTGRDTGSRVASCFVLGEVGHDLYCTPWENLEAMADYPTPHVTKLLQLDIVYAASEAVTARYMALREKIAARLAAPFGEADAARALEHLEKATALFGRLMLAADLPAARFAAAGMVTYAEYAIYTVNKTWVRFGVRRIPEEIAAMPRLPAGFGDAYRRIPTADAPEELRRLASALMTSLDGFVRTAAADVQRLPTPSPEGLRGSYEEIWSNWKNKMRLAEATGDPYLAWMSAASCQVMYEEMAGAAGVPRTDVMSGQVPGDPAACRAAFDAAMEAYRLQYEAVGLPVRYYDSIEAFEADYCSIQ